MGPQWWLKTVIEQVRKKCQCELPVEYVLTDVFFECVSQKIKITVVVIK